MQKIIASIMVMIMIAAPIIPACDMDADTDDLSYLYGMGHNNAGQQGDGTTTDVKTPTQIGSTLGTITKVVCFSDTQNNKGTTFFLADGKLYGMGDNSSGQIGIVSTTSFVKTPTQIGSTLGTITDVICSSKTTFFLADGKLYGMGDNNFGEQGDGTTTKVTTPTQIGSTLGTITKVVCSNKSTFFLADGKLYGMGYNNAGQQGDGTTTNVKTPTQIGSTLGTITDVICSESSTFFLTADGKLYGMGRNTEGQQGNGSTTNVKTPTQIGSTLGTITKVVCSNKSTFFLADGKLYGMGYNNAGQQGDGTTTNVKTPTQIGSTLGTITDVICSESSTFFLTADGKLYGMGGNAYGQIGDGTTTDVTTPTQIGSTLGTITDVICTYGMTFFFLKVDSATVTIDVDGNGSVSQNSINTSVGSIITTSGNTLTINGLTVTATPTESTPETSHSFVGWSVESGTVVSRDMTITASFTSGVREYTVTLDPDGGQAAVDTITGHYMDVVDLPDTAKKDGYFFKGWYTEPDGSGSKVADPYTITEDITLYAAWDDDHGFSEIIHILPLAAVAGLLISLTSTLLFRRH